MLKQVQHDEPSRWSRPIVAPAQAGAYDRCAVSDGDAMDPGLRRGDAAFDINGTPCP